MIDMTEWLVAIRADLASLARQDLGYPLGTNEVRERSLLQHGPSFHEDIHSPVHRVAASVSDFLVHLRGDIHAFVEGNSEHEFMVR